MLNDVFKLYRLRVLQQFVAPAVHFACVDTIEKMLRVFSEAILFERAISLESLYKMLFTKK